MCELSVLHFKWSGFNNSKGAQGQKDFKLI